MGKLNKYSKYSNLYDRNGKLIRKAPLKPYSIQELEDLLEHWPEGIEYAKARLYAANLLMQLYQNPRTKEDKEYIAKTREEFLAKLKEKSTKEQSIEKLEELSTELTEEKTENDERRAA